MRIETKRLIIRDFNELDIDSYHLIKSKSKQAYFAGFKPHKDIKTTKYQLQSILLLKDYFAITLKDGTLIGDLNLYQDPIRKNVNAWQLGFLLDETYWGNGYMPEAIKGFLAYLFKKYSISILCCVTMVDNFNAQKTIERVGFRFDGIIRQYKKLYNGDIIDCKIYTMTKEEYERNELLCQKN